MTIEIATMMTIEITVVAINNNFGLGIVMMAIRNCSAGQLDDQDSHCHDLSQTQVFSWCLLGALCQPTQEDCQDQQFHVVI